METKQKENLRRIASLLSFLLAISLALNIIQFYNKKPIFASKKKLIEKNETLKSRARRAIYEIEKYKGISEKLDKVVDEANIKLAEQEKKIYKILAEKNELSSENENLNRELEDIQEKYFNIIDSMLIEQHLNASLQEALEDLENKIEVLNVKVGFASLLVVDHLRATPLHEKGHGGPQRKTALARRTNVVNVCFDIMENMVAKKGEHKIYLRIIDPSGNILDPPENKRIVMKNPETGSMETVSLQEGIDYQNERTSKCLRWHPNGEMAVGVYLVEVFSEKQKLGTTTFTLR